MRDTGTDPECHRRVGKRPIGSYVLRGRIGSQRDQSKEHDHEHDDDYAVEHDGEMPRHRSILCTCAYLVHRDAEGEDEEQCLCERIHDPLTLPDLARADQRRRVAQNIAAPVRQLWVASNVEAFGLERPHDLVVVPIAGIEEVERPTR
jgi:hypothetical protein